MACCNAADGPVMSFSSCSGSVVSSPTLSMDFRPNQRTTGVCDLEVEVTDDGFSIWTLGGGIVPITGFATAAAVTSFAGEAERDGWGLFENREPKRSKTGVLGVPEELLRALSTEERPEATSEGISIGGLWASVGMTLNACRRLNGVLTRHGSSSVHRYNFYASLRHNYSFYNLHFG
jgi:hypothetical protein